MDEVGQKLEFRYIALVFQRGQAEIIVNKLTERLLEAISDYDKAVVEEEQAKEDVNSYYGKQMLV